MNIEKASAQEQRVLECLPTSQQAITVLAVERLLGFKEFQAKKLLKEMTDKGLIGKRGRGRTVYYVRAENIKIGREPQSVTSKEIVVSKVIGEPLVKTSEYRSFILEIKQRIQVSQIKAAIAVNQELLLLYWDLAERIVTKQQQAAWGDGFLLQISKDLKTEFPEMKGFSKRNLEGMRQWYQFWVAESAIALQLVAQIPWGHNLTIVTKIKDIDEALFYVQKTIQNNWSRSVLTHQIEGRLYQREGKAITNFETRLPEPQSDLARETLKDPYNFDFLMLREKHDERELESALIENVTRFLLELGAGFSYLGRQYKLEVGGDEFFIDLLFYHVQLHCYFVIELKTVKFKPEFAGKLGFYISAVDGILKTEQDNPTIGLLICKSKNDVVVEYTLRDIHKPIGVSEYMITQNLPDELKSSLPSIEEIEAELGVGDE
jgi:predicted nuclease of restriction endonuclease-like (RecB) superfamily